MVKHSTNQAPSAFLMRLGKEDTISFVRKNKFKTNYLIHKYFFTSRFSLLFYRNFLLTAFLLKLNCEAIFQNVVLKLAYFNKIICLWKKDK